MEGRAYSSTSVPATIDDPPAGYLDDADERPAGEDAAYTGLDDYQLKNGIYDDDKKRWATTDFIRWLASGATLVATGQVHDSDEAATSEVSSQAWGAKVIEAEVTQDEGDVAEITAENRISFSYMYTISGPRILDAKVLLNGSCVDIHGKVHTFSLSDVRSESVTERIGIKRMHVRRQRDTAKVAAGSQAKSSSRGVSGRASFDASYEVADESEDGVTINTSIDRALPGAGGNTGSESAVVVEDKVTGETLLKKTYTIFSQGAVALAARGSKDATTVVLLQRFKIENTLNVFKKAERLKSPTDVEPPPPGGGTSTPGEDDGGGAGGNGVPDDGPADEESGAGDAGGDAEEAGSGNDGHDADGIGVGGSGTGENSVDRSSLWLDGLDGVSLHVSFIAPDGTADEAGSVTGELHLVLSEPAPRDLVFSIVVEPHGALAILQGTTLTIAEGSRLGGGALEAIEAGEATVSVHLLDEHGALSGRETAVTIDCPSNGDRTAPEIYACGGGDAWHAGSGATIFALRGQQAPALVIGRLGFSNYETSSTTVSITVQDPDGVLPPLPAIVTIPAGQAEARLELPLQDVEGTAHLTLRSGDSELDVYVVSRTQNWDALPVIRIPVGATAVVPFELRWSERTGRTVLAAATDGSIARPVDGGESSHLVAGSKLGAATVRGESVGRTEIRYESEGLPVLAAVVEVVPARVRLVGGQLQIANLPIGTEGTIALAVPDGVTIADVVVPPEASSYLTVTGSGTDRVVLRFTPSPEVPAILRLEVRFEGMLDGPAGGPVPVDIDEDLREDSTLPVHNSYRIEADS